MKATEIKKMTAEELDKTELDSRSEIFKLRRQATTGQCENPSRIRLLRKDIARIETERTARSKQK